MSILSNLASRFGIGNSPRPTESTPSTPASSTGVDTQVSMTNSRHTRLFYGLDEVANNPTWPLLSPLILREDDAYGLREDAFVLGHYNGVVAARRDGYGPSIEDEALPESVTRSREHFEVNGMSRRFFSAPTAAETEAEVSAVGYDGAHFGDIALSYQHRARSVYQGICTDYHVHYEPTLKERQAIKAKEEALEARLSDYATLGKREAFEKSHQERVGYLHERIEHLKNRQLSARVFPHLFEGFIYLAVGLCFVAAEFVILKKVAELWLDLGPKDVYKFPFMSQSVLLSTLFALGLTLTAFALKPFFHHLIFREAVDVGGDHMRTGGSPILETRKWTPFVIAGIAIGAVLIMTLGFGGVMREHVVKKEEYKRDIKKLEKANSDLDEEEEEISNRNAILSSNNIKIEKLQEKLDEYREVSGYEYITSILFPIAFAIAGTVCLAVGLARIPQGVDGVFDLFRITAFRSQLTKALDHYSQVLPSLAVRSDLTKELEQLIGVRLSLEDKLHDIESRIRTAFDSYYHLVESMAIASYHNAYCQAYTQPDAIDFDLIKTRLLIPAWKTDDLQAIIDQGKFRNVSAETRRPYRRRPYLETRYQIHTQSNQ